MRRVLAAALDAGCAAGLAYLGFRLAIQAAGCRDEGNCVQLTPLAIMGVLAALALYFGVGYLLWRATPAEKLLVRKKMPW